METQVEQAKFIRDSRREDGLVDNRVAYANNVISYAQRRTIGELIKNPKLYEASVNTIKYLKRYIAKV